MKPAPFRYFRPETVAEALELLAQYAEDCALLAGGQSLVPTMNFRLARPAVLIDLNRVQELFFVEAGEDSVRIGAMTRQAALQRSPLIETRAPLLYQTVPHIAHPQIRNRGTVGGSLAHADPSAELPAVMTACNARFRLQSSSEERWVGVNEFFTGMFTTCRQPQELLAEVEVPELPAGAGWDFQEIARRHGDYALVGVAAVVIPDSEGTCREVRLCYLSIGDGVVRGASAESSLQGRPGTDSNLKEAAHIAAHEDVQPLDDMHASVHYKRHLVEVLTCRALANAVARSNLK